MWHPSVKVYAMNTKYSNGYFIYQLYSKTNVTNAGVYKGFSLEELDDK
jgi:hypothetical protein